MGLTVPSFGVMNRISPLLFEQSAFWFLRPLLWFGIDYILFEPYIHANNNPNNVFVSVLTDNLTYSSAKLMSTWVADGGFGNIIGGLSRQAPNAFGEIFSFYLPYSNFYVTVSSSQFLRPNVNADPVVLLPDILIDPSYALEVALEYLRR